MADVPLNNWLRFASHESRCQVILYVLLFLLKPFLLAQTFAYSIHFAISLVERQLGLFESATRIATH
jgi:hypothetical protein